MPNRIKPTRMKVLEGNPGRRPLPSLEPSPQIEDSVPNPPSHLNIHAKKEWKSMAKKLHRLGLLTEVDHAALAAYCQLYGRWVDAELKLKKTGILIKAKKGGACYQSPALGIANRCLELMHKFLTQFGMTPCSRTKAVASGGTDGSKFSGLLSKKRF